MGNSPILTDKQSGCCLFRKMLALMKINSLCISLKQFSLSDITDLSMNDKAFSS